MSAESADGPIWLDGRRRGVLASPPALTQIAFANGIDESIEPEVLDPAQAFAVLVNGRQDRRGGYAKRLGFGFYENDRFDATERTTGVRLFEHAGSPCVCDATQLDRYDFDKALWRKAGRLPECSVSTRVTPAIGTNLLDAVLCNGYLVFVTHIPDVDSGVDAVYAHVETVDGVVVRDPQIVGIHISSPAAVNACLGVYGNIVILVRAQDDSANMPGQYLDCSTAATIASGWQSLGNVATDKTTTGTGAYLFSTQSLDAAVAFAYVNDSGGASQVTVKLLTSAGVGTTQTVNTSSAKPNAVGLGGSTADRLYVAWNESTDLKMIGLSPTALTTSSTVGTVMTSVVVSTACPYILPTGTGAGWVAVKGGVTSMRAWTAGAAMAGSGTQNIACAVFLGRPFVRAGRLYGLWSPEATNEQGLAILGDWTDTNTSPSTLPTVIRPIATAFQGQVRTALGQAYAQPITLGNDRYAYPVLIQRAASEHRGVALVTYDFGDTSLWNTASDDATTFLAGGIVSALAGSTLSEAGFLQAPAPVTLGSTGTGLTGTFSYVATFETIDGAGNLVTSAVSTPVSITVSNKTITASVPPLCLTSRILAITDYRVRVSFWRTVDGGEAPYYFVSSAIINTASTSAGIEDAMVDATLATRRLLYGTGNLPGQNGSGLNRDAPPHADDVVSFNGMIVVLSGAFLWWSGQQVDGEARWWNNEFQSQLPGKGDGVALAVQDGTLYVFKTDRIFAYGGESPADNGSFGGLGAGRLLSSDVGCVNKRSICVCGLGVFFQSARGIELLERSGAVTWVGEKVQQTLADYPTITSAVLDSRNSLVRIVVTDGEEGRTLVYDLTLRAWVSVDYIQGSLDAEASVDAAFVAGSDGVRRYTWLGSDGYVWPERDPGDADAHLDGTEWFNREAQTGSFKTGGIQGKQFLNRLLVLERYATDHNLEVSLAYNYESSFRTARTWTRAQINSLLTDGWPITQLRHDAHDDAECQSVRVRLVETTPTGGTVGSGKGATWLALTLDLTPRPGTFDVPEGAV